MTAAPSTGTILAAMADEEAAWRSDDYPTGVNRQRELAARGPLTWPYAKEKDHDDDDN